MIRFRRYNPGDRRIDAQDFNARASTLEAISQSGIRNGYLTPEGSIAKAPDRLPSAGFWAELTGEQSAGYDFKELIPDGSGGLKDGSPQFTGTAVASEVNGVTGIPDGTIVWMRRTRNDGTGHRYIFDIGFAKDGTRATIGSTGEDESADATTWDRDAQAANEFGVTVTVMTRIALETGSGNDAVLYAYYRDFEYEGHGHLVSVSAETRVNISNTVDCGGA